MSEITTVWTVEQFADEVTRKIRESCQDNMFIEGYSLQFTDGRNVDITISAGAGEAFNNTQQPYLENGVN